MPQELADKILKEISIEYSQKEVENWYNGLPNDAKYIVKDLVKSFVRVHPNHAIYAFNFYMQLADKTITHMGSKIIRLPNYDNVYNNKFNNSVREVVVHRELKQDIPYPGERIFNYFQGFVRTPYAEYKAFASMRDMGSNMEKIISRLDNLEKR